MEEEEEEGWAPRRQPMGFVTPAEEGEPEQAKIGYLSEAYQTLLTSLAEERRNIIDDDSLSARDKLQLLDENRKTLVVANGGTVRKTDSVVYGILIFGATVLIVLALLTTYAGLPAEVTLSFVGTVLGGTIATIAQKLGKL
jgi:hypothetical protein